MRACRWWSWKAAEWGCPCLWMTQGLGIVNKVPCTISGLHLFKGPFGLYRMINYMLGNSVFEKNSIREMELINFSLSYAVRTHLPNLWATTWYYRSMIIMFFSEISFSLDTPFYELCKAVFYSIFLSSAQMPCTRTQFRRQWVFKFQEQFGGPPLGETETD